MTTQALPPTVPMNTEPVLKPTAAVSVSEAEITMAETDKLGGQPNGVNGHANEATPNFTLRDTTVENFRPLRAVVVGAGFSGICAAIRIPERLRNVDLTVYEKNEGIGGVWFLNKYPGLACDIPSHSYQYSFAPNPHWSKMYAPGAEIQRYLQNTAERFGATRFIKTQHRVDRCEYLADEKKWKVTVTNLATGETFEDKADVLITARGQLNEVNWPNVPGMEKFQGKLLHSAEWDDNYDFKNKKVGIIGNGSSAIQIIPSLQKLEGTKLTCFMRSPTWIAGAFGDNAMKQLGLDPSQTEFNEEQKQAFASDPAGYLATRKVIENDGNLIHDSTIRGSDMQAQLIDTFRTSMTTKLATKPDLLKTIIPAFAPGCRRLTPGVGFLEALTKPNVDVVTERISTITETGVTTTDGRHFELDALACATGFRVSEPPPFPVIGRHGQTLKDRWTPYPESYLSVAVDGFPNYFMMFGPNSAIGFGSLTKILEAETDYVCKIIRKMQKEDYASVEPLPQRVKNYSDYCQEYFKNTVYTDNCKSWYRSQGGEGDRIIGLWPGSTLHALEALRSPRWEDFMYEYVDEQSAANPLRWLGNGWSETQKNGDPSWYINPNEVDWPHEGKPEENPKYLARPWCH